MPIKCEFVDFPCVCETRGNICFSENADLPFPVQRVFWIYGVEEMQTRGGHAHRTCHEIVIPLNGAFSLRLVDGKTEQIVRLDSPRRGMVIPAMTWCDLFDFAPDTVCLCLASEPYQAEGYINSFENFIKEVQ